MSLIKNQHPVHVEHQIHPLSINTPTADPSAVSLSDKVAHDLTRENFKLKDNNGDGQITVSYKFFNSSDPDTAWLKNGGAFEFSQARKKAFKRAMQAWEDVVKVKFTENAKDADAFLYCMPVTVWVDMPAGQAMGKVPSLASASATKICLRILP